MFTLLTQTYCQLDKILPYPSTRQNTTFNRKCKTSVQCRAIDDRKRFSEAATEICSASPIVAGTGEVATLKTMAQGTVLLSDLYRAPSEPSIN
jgi:hypothetical protein